MKRITHDQAQAKLVDAIQALKACHTTDWYDQMLVVAGICYEKLEHDISQPNPAHNKIDHDMISAICKIAEANPEDWMPRIARMMLLVEISARDRLQERL